jgi:hypothetical protein
MFSSVSEVDCLAPHHAHEPACSELEKEKAKADDGAAAWIERARQLEVEVDKEKDRADKLDRVNQVSKSANS